MFKTVLVTATLLTLVATHLPPASAQTPPAAPGARRGAPGAITAPGNTRGGASTEIIPDFSNQGAQRSGVGTPPPPRPNPLPPFYDPKLPLDKRVDDLVGRLTLEEKVAQMQMTAPAIARLGIAPYDWWSEALHGFANTGLATVFPQAIGMAAAWDVDLHLQMAKIIGMEARAKHLGFVARNDFSRFKGLDLWSPNVNIFRDPRWGRGQETYGEDPYLSGRLGIQFVKGLQGDDPFYFLTIATPKHFAVHSGPEALRHRFDAVITDQDLYTTYLPQFEATVREGKTYSIMSAYSALNGVPDTGNKRLLTDILRTQWGFKGYVVSDVDSVSDIFLPNSHGYVPSAVEASALAVRAGNELNSGSTYGGGGNGNPSNLAKAVQAGLITQQEVDLAVRRLMEARIRLGEFDPPKYEGNPYNKITEAMNDLPESDAVAHKYADEAMVLLKNENNTLPLKTTLGTVAVLGPNANALSMQYGEYNGTPSPQHRMSIIDGIRKAVGAEHVITTNQLQVPLTSDRMAFAEVVKPEFLYTDAKREQHGLSVAYATTTTALAQPALKAVSETGELMRPAAGAAVSFDPRLAALMTGVLVPPVSGDYQLGIKGRDNFRLKIDGKVVIDGMSQGGGMRGMMGMMGGGAGMRTSGAFVTLKQGNAYGIEVEFTHSQQAAGGRGRGRGMGGGMGGFGGGRGGRGARGGAMAAFGATAAAPGVTISASADASTTEPLVSLIWTRPTADGVLADTEGKPLYGEAVELVKKADAVVVVVGISPTMENEGRDRTTIELPTVQENLVKQVVKTAGSKPVVVVNCSGSAIALGWTSENVPAIIQAWYPGQRGDAVADVIFGKYNPAGRLPVTFYKSTADLPEFTDYSMVGRTYRYDTKPVLYPFGHGLSYSTFEYSGLNAPKSAGTGDDVKVSVNVKNTSTIDGDEVVQCYINRDVPAIDRKTLPEPAKMSDELATQVATPRKSLVGFARVPLKAGESKAVSFTVTPQQLSLVVGKDGKREVRPGNLQIQVGGSSAIGPQTLTQALTLEGSPKAPEYQYVAPVVK